MRGEWICRKYGNEKTPRCRMCTGEFLERGESESASTAAAKEQDDPQTGVVSAEIVAASASAAVTSAAKTTAAAKEQDDKSCFRWRFRRFRIRIHSSLHLIHSLINPPTNKLFTLHNMCRMQMCAGFFEVCKYSPKPCSCIF